MDRAVDVALLELVLLANVDRRDIAAIELGGGLAGLHLLDLGFGLAKRVGAAHTGCVSVSGGFITSESIATRRGYGKAVEKGTQPSAGRICRRRRTRSSIGGWVLNRLAMAFALPPESGLTM